MTSAQQGCPDHSVLKFPRTAQQHYPERTGIWPAMPKNQECKQAIKGQRRDDEQVHGGDVRRVVTQKGAPSLTWRSMPLDHVLRNAGLRDLIPELVQLAVDTRRSPSSTTPRFASATITSSRFSLLPR